MKSLQFSKLVRQCNVEAEEWMSRFRMAAIECNYREIDRHLKEQFIIHGLNNNGMMVKIRKELTETKESTSNEVLQWAR